ALVDDPFATRTRTSSASAGTRSVAPGKTTSGRATVAKVGQYSGLLSQCVPASSGQGPPIISQLEPSDLTATVQFGHFVCILQNRLTITDGSTGFGLHKRNSPTVISAPGPRGAASSPGLTRQPTHPLHFPDLRPTMPNTQELLRTRFAEACAERDAIA